MILCRVTGDVVSTVKNSKLEGNRILTLQPVALDCRTPVGGSFLGLDVAQAGVGDLVLVIKEGGGVRIIFEDDQIPLSIVVVAVVDDLDLADEASLVGDSTLEHRLSGAFDE